MNRQRHEEELLGPYVLGVLDAEEVRRIEGHMSGCVQCREEVAALREMEAALGEVPEEAFLDGPPQGGDLLLQRTLRQMRGERAGAARRRAGLTGLAVAATTEDIMKSGADEERQPPVYPGEATSERTGGPGAEDPAGTART
ncbi:anti-sigma factor, partial [Streptomyces sp. WAC05950]|uniref:anti-sigma factor family protein n=1 Tax=Streptomyces sp. WAC05950 TaxID=2487419 RepID=UPI001651E047